MTKNRSKLVIVDDHPLFLQGLESALEDSFYIKLIASFTDPLLAKKYIAVHPVDIVICDIAMPGLDGFGLLKFINKTKNTKSVFMSALNDSFTIKRAYKLGVYGFISKDASILELFKALDLVRKEENIFLLQRKT